MNGGAELTFHCPACGESMAVNASMRDALIEHGCVVCGSSLSEGAFSPEGDEDDADGCA